MSNLPLSLTIEKNKLATSSAFVTLFQVYFSGPPATTLYITNNTEPVIYPPTGPSSHTYTPIPIEIDIDKTTNKGEIPTISLRISNISRIMQGYAEQYKGGVGAKVTIIVVNSVNLGESYENYPAFYRVYNVTVCNTDNQWCNFTLGVPNLLKKRHPPYIYMVQNCMWVFYYKGVECKYGGGLPTCAGNHTDCVLHNNTPNFGGFLGLQAGRLRVA